MKKVLKLGTRRSLLAWTQSTWVAKELERLNRDITVELVGIETQGDRIQDVPLQKVEGKEFFVAEIDEALRTEKVDLTVHSLKDLSLDRPKEFITAAIPRRENQRDVVLFGPSSLTRLTQGKTIRIGTSSPRRLENLPGFLEKALPKTASGPQPKIEFVEIRGNVNTRLARVHEYPENEKYLDAVVLAFAGLIRLYQNDESKEKMKPLLRGLKWMVMPLMENPTAPGQGALSVECRSKDTMILDMIRRLDDASSRSEVQSERDVLREFGGGCHQRFGASSVTVAEIGKILVIRGKDQSSKSLNEIRWASPQQPLNKNKKPWDGSLHRSERLSAGESAVLESLQNVDFSPIDQTRCVFVSHARAVASQEIAKHLIAGADRKRIWAAGSQTWFKLAEKGIWVEGCAEGLGWESIRSTLKEPLLELDALDQWGILTHQEAPVTEGQKIATYRMTTQSEWDSTRDLSDYTHFYWGSGTQFRQHEKWVPRSAHHACGPGKTASILRTYGITPQVFPNIEQWRKWVQS